MERTPVISTQVKSVGYDQKTKTLEVQFLNGENVVRYYAVPQKKYEALITADSLGGYLSDKIKGVHRIRTMK